MKGEAASADTVPAERYPGILKQLSNVMNIYHNKCSTWMRPASTGNVCQSVHLF